MEQRRPSFRDTTKGREEHQNADKRLSNQGGVGGMLGSQFDRREPEDGYRPRWGRGRRANVEEHHDGRSAESCTGEMGCQHDISIKPQPLTCTLFIDRWLRHRRRRRRPWAQDRWSTTRCRDKGRRPARVRGSNAGSLAPLRGEEEDEETPNGPARAWPVKRRGEQDRRGVGDVLATRCTTQQPDPRREGEGAHIRITTERDPA